MKRLEAGRDPRWVHVMPLQRLETTCLPEADEYAIVVDARVWRYWKRELRRALPPDGFYLWQGGEMRKRWRSLESLFRDWMRRQLTRHAVVVGVGGGALIDAVGLAASVYKRGLRTVWIPTTLLAMVDAAIGGKNAVNFWGVKNLLGTFHWPEKVIQCPDFLKTLPSREWMSGMGEIVKHALIVGGRLWDAIQRIPPRLPIIDIDQWIEQAASVKAWVVTEDPYEHGLRKALNVGHTVGHALESYWAQQGCRLPHGIAVMAGMAWEAAIAYEMGIAPLDASRQIIDVMYRYPIARWMAPTQQWMSYWLHDKKNQRGTVGMALPVRPGHIEWNVQCPVGDLPDLVDRATQWVMPSNLLIR